MQAEPGVPRGARSERDRLQKELDASERTRRDCESELRIARMRDEMREWFLTLIVPIVGITFLILVVAARR